MSYCECGELADRDCMGRERCPMCDDPCPCCDDGGMDAQNNGPEEGDLTTGDHSEFWMDGNRVLVVDPEASRAEMWAALDAFMGEIGVFPAVWWISDHGNAHPLER